MVVVSLFRAFYIFHCRPPSEFHCAILLRDSTRRRFKGLRARCTIFHASTRFAAVGGSTLPNTHYVRRHDLHNSQVATNFKSGGGGIKCNLLRTCLDEFNNCRRQSLTGADQIAKILMITITTHKKL